MIFNFIYANCLWQRSGVMVHHRDCFEAAWHQQDTRLESQLSPATSCEDNIDLVSHDTYEHVTEATYVDDDALFMSSSSPKVFQTALKLAVIRVQFQLEKFGKRR